jgi:hypothetical protein
VALASTVGASGQVTVAYRDDILAIFAHPPKTEDLHQTLSRIGFQRRISAGNALD